MVYEFFCNPPISLKSWHETETETQAETQTRKHAHDPLVVRRVRRQENMNSQYQKNVNVAQKIVFIYILE